ncbi:hypothetical protein [Rhodococcus sp. 14-2496-1d]|uniref:hypothetical protein n=1 Tax=Rhodococcus sp. 14-2496-1d TaxID=2023146 RepID=UPI0015C67B76|nr:hypothetical protein [Rhodococcus sp. 14-2496-1d]
MGRTILSDDMLALLASQNRQPIAWSQQPLQQQMDKDDPDDDNDVDDEDDPDDDKDVDEDDPDDDKDVDDEDDPDDKKLGPKGERALERIKEKLRNEKKLRREAEQKVLDAATDGKTKTAERDILAKANSRILRSEVRAAAAGKLADPADAVKFLDLDQFDVGEDGDVDQDEIEDAIEDLVKRKPYLAAQGGEQKKRRTPKGDRRQGGGGRDASGTVSAGRSLYEAKKKKTT